MIRILEYKSYGPKNLFLCKGFISGLYMRHMGSITIDIRRASGVGSIIIFTIGMLLALLVSSYIYATFIASEPRELARGLNIARSFEYEKGLERATVWMDLLNPQNTPIYLNNTGSETINIVRIWILDGDYLQTLSYKASIPPGGYLDLNALARELSTDLGKTIYVTDIVSLVSSRGSVFPIRDRVLMLQTQSSSFIETRYREEFVRIFPRPENTLWYLNFTNLIKSKRLEGYYQGAVSGGGTCEVKAYPAVDYLQGYDTPLLLLKDAQGRVISIVLDNYQSGCLRYVFKNVSSIWNLQDIYIYLKIVVRSEKQENKPGNLGGLWVNVTISFINSTLKRLSSMAGETIYIPMRDEPAFNYVWQVLVKLDHRFFTVDILREYQDMEIRIDLFRAGDIRYRYTVGIDYVVIQGAGVYG